MKNSKFNILFEQIMNSNKLDQEYFNNCNLLMHDQPVKYNNYFIQIFVKNTNNQGFKDHQSPYYFAYILDQYGTVKTILRQTYLNKNECLLRAQEAIDNNEINTLTQNNITIRKTEKQFVHKPHTTKYGFFDKKSQTDFSLTSEQFNNFLQLLNNNDLIKSEKAKYIDLLMMSNSNNKEDLTELIKNAYTLIDLNIVQSTDLPNNVHKVIFRLILPYTKLNWFNSIFRKTFEQVTQN